MRLARPLNGPLWHVRRRPRPSRSSAAREPGAVVVVPGRTETEPRPETQRRRRRRRRRPRRVGHRAGLPSTRSSNTRRLSPLAGSLRPVPLGPPLFESSRPHRRGYNASDTAGGSASVSRRAHRWLGVGSPLAHCGFNVDSLLLDVWLTACCVRWSLGRPVGSPQRVGSERPGTARLFGERTNRS